MIPTKVLFTRLIQHHLHGCYFVVVVVVVIVVVVVAAVVVK